jgi:flavin reductase (DIM6/NTAB) family NADH-FMN oxidoreductase RutF
VEPVAPTTEEVKGALRRLACSVAIITSYWNGRRLAMAATAVNGLSLAPPSLLVCVNQAATLYGALAAGARFCVNILGQDHVELAQRCGGQVAGAERFSTGAWGQDEEGVPYLEDAQASLSCVCDDSLVYGTHGVFVGKITSVRLHGVIAPLIYADARYCGASQALQI